MKYAKIENGIVIQTQPNQEDGFLEVKDSVYCGMKLENGEYVIPPKTTEQIKAEFINTIQVMLDTKAQEKSYDNIVSACSYAGYDNPFRAEGEAYGVWRALCWQKGYKILSDVESGLREMPTIEEVIAEMPTLELV